MNTSSIPQLIDPTTGQQLTESDIKGFCEYYDACPVLFAIENPSKMIFFGVAIHHNALTDTETYLYAPISGDRYEQAMAGKIQLKDIYTHADGGFVYKITVFYREEKPPVIIPLPCSVLPDCWLPAAGEYVKNSH